MGLTAAEKQRRYRRRVRLHAAGDHSLCGPKRGCSLATEPPAPAPAREVEQQPARPAVAETFGSRGTQLWDDMSGAQLGPAHRVLLVEACRLADRLDKLDGLMTGAQWLREREDEDERVVIVVDALLGETRQHASALRAIVAQLEPRPKVTAPAQPKNGGGGLADLTARIEARRSQITAG